MDDILAKAPGPYAARIVNFHADWSSEKRVIGYYLDGKVSAVIGDHWHVPTADAMVLPKGTAHITDVGMVGTLHSSLGVSLGTIVDRWRNGVINRNDIAEGGPYQFNAVLVTINPKNGQARSIEPVQKIVESL
jgi:calcineurin-like phosphoesterase